MAEFPALHLWTDAYLGDTTHLNVTQHGAYLLLLMTAWRSTDCSLPDDDQLLARYARCTAAQWRSLKPVIADFFHIEDGRWRQGRLSDEFQAAVDRREKAAANGRASALKRKGRHTAKRERGVNGASAERELQSNLTIDTNITPLSPLNERAAKRPLPGDWEPEEFGETTECRSIIDGWSRVDLERQLERFKAHHEREGSRYSNWQAAWKTWVLNSPKFDNSRSGHSDRSKDFDLVEQINANPDRWRGDV